MWYPTVMCKGDERIVVRHRYWQVWMQVSKKTPGQPVLFPSNTAWELRSQTETLSEYIYGKWALYLKLGWQLNKSGSVNYGMISVNSPGENAAKRCMVLAHASSYTRALLQVLRCSDPRSLQHGVHSKMADVLENVFGPLREVGGDIGKQKRRRTSQRTWKDCNSNTMLLDWQS